MMFKQIMIVANVIATAVATGIATENPAAGVAVLSALTGIILLVDQTADSVIRGIKR